MRELKIDEFFNYSFLSNLQVSSNGNIGLTVKKVDSDNNSYKSSIYVKKNDSFMKLTGLDQESSYIWLNNDEILFTALRDSADKKTAESGKPITSFYKININGGEAVKQFTLPLLVTSYKQINEDNLVLTAMIDANHPDYYLLDEEKQAEILKQYKDESDYQVVDEIPWWNNGGSFSVKKRNGLFTYNISSNKLELLTNPLFSAETVKVHKNKIYFTGCEYESKYTFDGVLYTYDCQSKKLTTLIENGVFLTLNGIEFINDEMVLIANEGKKYGIHESSSFYRFNLETNTIKQIAYNEYSIGSSVGTDTHLGGGKSVIVLNDKLYFITTYINASIIKSVDLNGNVEVVYDKEGSVDFIDGYGDSLYFAAMKDMELQEIYSLNLNSTEIKKVTNFNEKALDEIYVATPKKLSIKTTGHNVDGWVLLPKDYDESKSYPAIMDIHGGPMTVYGEVFYHEMQYWANKGYFVFFCNPFGSDGKGNEFADLRGKYGTVDYDDLMAFEEAVVAKYPQIDKTKIGVTGGSYGGYMTNWIIGHTNRFCAAAAQRSISNWFSMYGCCDIGYFFGNEQNDADVFSEDGQNKMWWHSPLKYVGNAVTPTLFIHSTEDYRCWIPEAMQMFTALKEKGVEARMCIFKGENHELSRSGKPLHRVRRLTEITDWMDKHCK